MIQYRTYIEHFKSETDFSVIFAQNIKIGQFVSRTYNEHSESQSVKLV